MRRAMGMRLAVLLSSGLVCSGAFAQSPQGDGDPAAAPAMGNSASVAKPGAPVGKPAPARSAAATGKAAATGTHLHYQPSRFSGRAGTYYRVIWGVDSLAVKWVESGELIRFSYRVLDSSKAQALNDKKSEPSLVSPKGVSLVIPQMENVGQLRQSTVAEDGKSYWMTFSNKGRLVKRGDHVSVVIGGFRADGLVVD
jgi:hypothetical protein